MKVSITGDMITGIHCTHSSETYIQYIWHHIISIFKYIIVIRNIKAIIILNSQELHGQSH